jgi:parallel beta-helix repeat protein
LTGDVTVNSGATLTITKGVKVIFLADNDDVMSGDMTYDSELIVKGSISVQGTEAEPVTFTTSETVGRAGQWGGIKLEGTSASGEFKHAVVEYSSYGIYFAGISNRTVKIEESVIRYNSDYGIRAGRNASGNNNDNAKISVTNSQIVDNFRHGIHAGNEDYGNWEIKGCSILRNGEYGIYLGRSYKQVIENNIINENKYGCELRYISHRSSATRIVMGNEISKNKSWGLTCRDVSGDRSWTYDNYVEKINDNKINFNGGHGVRLYDWHRAKMEVKNNEIKSNKGDGFSFNDTLDTSLIFEDNVIENNEGQGVYFSRIYGNVLIQNNVIKKNYYSGLYVGKDNDQDRSDEIVIKNNVVSENKQGNDTRDDNGITLYYRSSATAKITGNTVEDGGGYGIKVENNSTLTSTQVESNTVKGNTKAGLRVYGRLLPSVKGNTFDGNGNGLELIYTDLNASGEFEVSGNAIRNSGGYGVRIEQYAQPTITGNDLDGSGGYTIDNQTSKGINAKNNWWGAAITLEMTTGDNPKNLIKVYDSYDDSNMGFVNYGGWLAGAANSVKYDITTVFKVSTLDGANAYWDASTDSSVKGYWVFHGIESDGTYKGVVDAGESTEAS